MALVLGDQLNLDSTALAGLDPARDAVWMAEVSNESRHVPSHKARSALFLSAMRHFRDRLRGAGLFVHYTQFSDGTLGEHLRRAVDALRPERVLVVQPGEWRVLQELRAAVPSLEVLEDQHFLCTTAEFSAHAAGRKQLRMEFFYREMRRKYQVLLDVEGRPEGGAWNYDTDNRGSFGARGPGLLPAPLQFEPDAITREVCELVESRLAGNPGSLRHFDWPVTPEDAMAALDDFVRNRLPHFGQFQDAMWSGAPWLYHSRISAALNLKLLDPLTVVRRAEEAWRLGLAPLASVEGFIRQVLGWREYVRGIYWRFMPEYGDSNALSASAPLPEFYWTGETEMNCLRETITQTLDYGYAHHIQRLMVTGLYALLAGVEPRQVHEWYLSMYVDAVEWVELPNTLGMSQYADGGVMASKPYAASGKYIDRMSNYCAGCRYDPGKDCPFTAMYWEFLERSEPLLRGNPRMKFQLKNRYLKLTKQ